MRGHLGFILTGIAGDTAQERALFAVLFAIMAAGALLFIHGLNAMAAMQSVPAFGVGLLTTFAGGALVKIGATTGF